MNADQIAERAVEKFTYRYTITEQGKQMLLGFILAAIEEGIQAFLDKKAAACLPLPDESPRAAPDDTKRLDLLELAWVIIANAGGGDWERESKEWQEAAAKWRDDYHASIESDDTKRLDVPSRHVYRISLSALIALASSQR